MQLSLFVTLLLICITSFFDTTSQLFLKGSVNSLQISSIRSIKALAQFIYNLLRVPKIWISFFCSTASVCFWLLVLSKTDLNLAFSLDSIHYIFIAMSSKIFLKEKVGLLRWVGTLCIVIGIVLVSLSR